MVFERRRIRLSANVSDPSEPPPVIVPFTRTVDDLVYSQFGDPKRTDKFTTWGKHETALYNDNIGIENTALDWYVGGRPGVAGPPWPQSYGGVSGYDHHNLWGEVIPFDSASPSAHLDVRVHIAGFGIYQSNDNGVSWIDQTPNPLGALDGGYWRTMKDDPNDPTKRIAAYSKSVDWVSSTPNPYWRYESEGYSFSVLPMFNSNGTPNYEKSIAHFFFNAFFPRKLLTGHIAIVARARIISDNPAHDLTLVKLAGRISGDAFISSDSVIGPNNRNPALGMPKLVKLGPEWRGFSYVSASSESIMRSICANAPFLVTP